MTEQGKEVAEGVFRHYTDAVGRDGIEMSGQISPGPSGRLYLTPDFYDQGSEAQTMLALPHRPVGYFEIPVERVFESSQPERVLARYGLPGGGLQVWTTRAIDVRGTTWVGIEP